MIEYSTLPEAREAIAQTNNTKLLDQTIQCDFAFVRPPPGQGGRRGENRGRGGRGGGGAGRPRSRSPGAADRVERSAGEEPVTDAPKLEDRITS